MEVVYDDNVKDIIKDELTRLGIFSSPEPSQKKSNYTSKFLHKSANSAYNKSLKARNRSEDFINSTSPLPDVRNVSNKKSGAKSPFSKNKARDSCKKKLLKQNEAEKVIFVL